MKNTTSDLKNFCFVMLQELTDPEKGANMEETLKKAEAVANLVGAANDTIKQEVQVMKIAVEFGITPDTQKFLGLEK